jgi:hypothetical protein
MDVEETVAIFLLLLLVTKGGLVDMCFRKWLNSVDFIRGKVRVVVKSLLVCFGLFLVENPTTTLFFYGLFFVADIEYGENKDCNESSSNDNWHEDDHCEETKQ